MYIYYNGNLLPTDSPIITADNRGLRYGDGLFETIKLVNSNILLAQLHYQRLFHGLGVLQIHIPSYFTETHLQQIILTLANKNNVLDAARIRVTVFRGNGALHDHATAGFNFIIQALPLSGSYMRFNDNGMSMDVYGGVMKSCDILCNLKTNNYLPYIMASQFAAQQQLDDCIVLNSYGRVCETTIANIFGVQGQSIFTPALAEGCVAGVMRQWLVENLPQAGYTVQEKPVSIEELLDSDEIFLTNALYGIRSVKRIRNKNYTNSLTAALYNKFISPKR